MNSQSFVDEMDGKSCLSFSISHSQTSPVKSVPTSFVKEMISKVEQLQHQRNCHEDYNYSSNNDENDCFSGEDNFYDFDDRRISLLRKESFCSTSTASSSGCSSSSDHQQHQRRNCHRFSLRDSLLCHDDVSVIDVSTTHSPESLRNQITFLSQSEAIDMKNSWNEVYDIIDRVSCDLNSVSSDKSRFSNTRDYNANNKHAATFPGSIQMRTKHLKTTHDFLESVRKKQLRASRELDRGFIDALETMSCEDQSSHLIKKIEPTNETFTARLISVNNNFQEDDPGTRLCSLSSSQQLSLHESLSCSHFQSRNHNRDHEAIKRPLSVMYEMDSSSNAFGIVRKFRRSFSSSVPHSSSFKPRKSRCSSETSSNSTAKVFSDVRQEPNDIISHRNSNHKREEQRAKRFTLRPINRSVKLTRSSLETISSADSLSKTNTGNKFSNTAVSMECNSRQSTSEANHRNHFLKNCPLIQRRNTTEVLTLREADDAFPSLPLPLPSIPKSSPPTFSNTSQSYSTDEEDKDDNLNSEFLLKFIASQDHSSEAILEKEPHEELYGQNHNKGDENTDSKDSKLENSVESQMLLCMEMIQEKPSIKKYITSSSSSSASVSVEGENTVNEETTTTVAPPVTVAVTDETNTCPGNTSNSLGTTIQLLKHHLSDPGKRPSLRIPRLGFSSGRQRKRSNPEYFSNSSTSTSVHSSCPSTTNEFDTAPKTTTGKRLVKFVDLLKYPHMMDTRSHVVGELHDTEKSYVESLDILVNKYMKPLKGNDQLIDPSLVDVIFFQVPEILKAHETFLEILSNRLMNWDSSQVIGDVFLEAFTQQPMVEIYTAFINNYTHAKECIRVASNSSTSSKTASAFKKFCKKTSREHKGKLTMDALLIMPVQRIPRYELLIKELIKHTESVHPDSDLLLQAKNHVHEIVLKINQRPPPEFSSFCKLQMIEDFNREQNKQRDYELQGFIYISRVL